MTQASRHRLALLAAGGGALVALSYALAPDGNGAAPGVELVASNERGAGRTTVARAEVAPALIPPARGPISAGAHGDPFAQLSFVPPPPPPPPPPPKETPPPPPPPKAPPVPFSFVGLVEQGVGRPQAFLARGEALHVVGVGDVLEDRYRVESLSPASVVLTYLPLSERQVLNANGGPQ